MAPWWLQPPTTALLSNKPVIISGRSKIISNLPEKRKLKFNLPQASDDQLISAKIDRLNLNLASACTCADK